MLWSKEETKDIQTICQVLTHHSTCILLMLWLAKQRAVGVNQVFMFPRMVGMENGPFPAYSLQLNGKQCVLDLTGWAGFLTAGTYFCDGLVKLYDFTWTASSRVRFCESGVDKNFWCSVLSQQLDGWERQDFRHSYSSHCYRASCPACCHGRNRELQLECPGA